VLLPPPLLFLRSPPCSAALFFGLDAEHSQASHVPKAWLLPRHANRTNILFSHFPPPPLFEVFRFPHTRGERLSLPRWFFFPAFFGQPFDFTTHPPLRPFFSLLDLRIALCLEPTPADFAPPPLRAKCRRAVDFFLAARARPGLFFCFPFFLSQPACSPPTLSFGLRLGSLVERPRSSPVRFPPVCCGRPPARRHF